jgi:hypothetical protein
LFGKIVDLHKKFAQEKIKTHEKSVYKDIFIVISNFFTPEAKVKKREKFEKRMLLTLFACTFKTMSKKHVRFVDVKKLLKQKNNWGVD